jgi:hypothetical protein
LDGRRAIFSRLFSKFLADPPFPIESASTLIMARTQAGIQRARERGVAFGRPTKLNSKQRRMIAERYARKLAGKHHFCSGRRKAQILPERVELG